jgi:multisubunit Na+/H+ antiporter MnhE subunit
MKGNLQKPPQYRKLILFFTLAAAWLLWSGLFQPLLLGLGLLSCLLTYLLIRRMESGEVSHPDRGTPQGSLWKVFP